MPQGRRCKWKSEVRGLAIVKVNCFIAVTIRTAMDFVWVNLDEITKYLMWNNQCHGRGS